MQKLMLQEKYPIYTFKLNKDKTNYKNCDEILNYFKDKINNNPVTTYISVFDHYAHTISLAEGEIHKDIKDAKNIQFCFGIKLPDPNMLAVRPRSIGVCEMETSFVISFLEAPMQMANDAMIQWVEDLEQ